MYVPTYLPTQVFTLSAIQKHLMASSYIDFWLMFLGPQNDTFTFLQVPVYVYVGYMHSSGYFLVKVKLKM
jgi:hypothetical protein